MMREMISKSVRKDLLKKYKKDPQCCLIKLNGKKLPTKEAYYKKLKDKLQLNDTFANNYNAYSDMMRDSYTYYNKATIVFMINHYDRFLEEDQGKAIIETIFDEDIIPFFENHYGSRQQGGTKKTIHVYCVES